MRLGLAVGYWQPGPDDPVELAKRAEDLGFDSIWTAEAYGSDCFTPLTWIGAHTSRIKLGTGIMHIGARTPASVAMTAMTLDHLTGGRLILGVGVSGPQVIEGWYGVPFAKPMARTREFVEVFRTIMRREGPAEYHGEHYQMPLPGGLGKPLKLITRPLRADIPIYIAAEGPKNVAQTFAIGDGWLPIFFSPYRPDMYEAAWDTLRSGFEIACPVTVVLNDDLEGALIPVKMMLAWYLGGMGAKGKNFHVNLVSRMGWEREAHLVQDLFLDDKRMEAVAAVPDELADEIALCGSAARIKDRLGAWKESRVTTILAGTRDPAALEVLAEALL